ncbi:MAG: leucine-rich repeat domain-containing protein, partial [Chloroflexi bacterium]|nr:leucine-rich repeat domain-containing protein [Chloroflexota bacterium]
IKRAKITNKRLASIVRRCAAFSPEERFADAAAVKKALLETDGRKQKRLARLFGAAALALFSLCAGFTVGRYTGFLSPPAIVDRVQFAEPLIERAVRVQLGKDESEPITGEDLLAVREIYVFGNEVSKTDEAFTDGLGGWLRDTPRGELTTLEDVRMLPNLEVLYVNYQTLTDISPASELRYLTTVSLRSTFVEDISALSGMKQLNNVCLFDTHVSDMSALGSYPALHSLDIGRTPITSLSVLPDIAGLRVLLLHQTQLASLDGIERFSHLEQLDLRRSMLSDLSPLLSLPHLQAISIDESMRGAAKALESPPFEIKYE